jgi:hypothetical protein
MEDWKRRLIDLHSEEQAREEAEAKEEERVASVLHRFLRGTAYEALKQLGDLAPLLERSSRLSAPEDGSVWLHLVRNGQPELTFEIEARAETSATLRVESGPSSYGERSRLAGPTELVREGETVADLTVERVRDAVVEILEQRLRGEL